MERPDPLDRRQTRGSSNDFEKLRQLGEENMALTLFRF